MYHHNSGPVTSESEDEFKRYIRDIPDFPKKGVIFRDITNLLKNGETFQKAQDVSKPEADKTNIIILCGF